MLISIVIPTHNRYDSLLELLRSIESQHFPHPLFEVLVVQQGKDSSMEPLKSMAWKVNIQWLSSHGQGPNISRNLGLTSASGAIAWLLDDDCVLDNPMSLLEVQKAHYQFPKATAIGGSYSFTPSASPVDKAYFIASSQWQQLDTFSKGTSRRLVGGNVSYKQGVIKQLDRLFDESILFGATEYEFHDFLRRQGHELRYLPHLQVSHRTNLKSEDVKRKAFLQATGAKRFGLAEPDNANLDRVDRRQLVAMQLAQTDDEFQSVIKSLLEYDQVFAETLDGHILTEQAATKWNKV